MIEDRETELSLVAAVIDPAAAVKASTVRRGDFANEDLGKLFDLIQWMHTVGEQPEGKLLAQRSREQNIFDFETIAQLFDRTFVERNSVTWYVHRIIDLSTRRKLIAEFDSVQKRLDNVGEDALEIAREVQVVIDAVVSRSTLMVRKVGDVAKEILATAKSETPAATIETGLERFDYHFGGFCPGDLVILAARTAIGKTALALQIAEHSATRGKHVLFASLEMRDTELVSRILARCAKLQVRYIRDRLLNLEDIDRLGAAVESIQGTALSVFAPPAATLTEIRAASKIAQVRGGLAFLVVDYLQIVKAEDRYVDRRLQICEMTRALKGLAKELHVPVLVLAQLTREADKGEPSLAMLKESSSIEEDADQVLLLHRESRESPKAKLILAKNRHGQTDAIELEYIGSDFRFATKSHEW